MNDRDSDSDEMSAGRRDPVEEERTALERVTKRMHRHALLLSTRQESRDPVTHSDGFKLLATCCALSKEEKLAWSAWFEIVEGAGKERRGTTETEMVS